MRKLFCLVFLLLLIFAHPARAASCGDTAAGFEAWLDDFKHDAAAKGISQKTLAAALADVANDRAIISRDRSGQRPFKLSFEKFAARLITPSRLGRGRDLLQRHADLLRRIEARYGGPGPVLISIWGLETGFDADKSNFKTLQALATLAYDCRRWAQSLELRDALTVDQSGDMSPTRMRGDWAGEIGQTQFMPSSDLKYAVDFDGDGRRDLIRSTADALASTANFLRGGGWQEGAGWAEGEPNFPHLSRMEPVASLCPDTFPFRHEACGGALG